MTKKRFILSFNITFLANEFLWKTKGYYNAFFADPRSHELGVTDFRFTNL